MNVRQKLTLNPKTQTGQELLCLSRELLKIKSIEHANNWQSKIKIWKGRLWSAGFNLGKLILNKTLFNFLNNCKVKSMNNVLVGGINSL